MSFRQTPPDFFVVGRWVGQGTREASVETQRMERRGWTEETCRRWHGVSGGDRRRAAPLISPVLGPQKTKWIPQKLSPSSRTPFSAFQEEVPWPSLWPEISGL